MSSDGSDFPAAALASRDRARVSLRARHSAETASGTGSAHRPNSFQDASARSVTWKIQMIGQQTGGCHADHL